MPFMSTDGSSQAELDRLAEEFVARTRAGESPSISSYVRANPALASDISDLFPVLQDLEGGDTAPDELGEYVLLREIGRGGMGVVYEAVQKTLGRRVALKVLPKQMTLDPRFLERFRLEAQAAARLQHPNIVPVIGWGEHEGVTYYTMQFVDGCGLDEADETPGTGTRYERVAQLMLQASEGIAAAHAQGVLHRDVKPSNLLLDDSGTVWISDFGLCKETESDGLTQPGDLLGTFRYMAPERFEGVSDVQGDVYGLGITLYELLTGAPAYEGDDRAALAAQIVRAAPPRPRKLDGEIPRDLELIVLKAIARDRSQRYPTAEALAADLRAFLDGKPISARPPTAGYLLRSFVRRHKAITVIGVVALFALVASTAYYVGSLREKESVARFRQYVANIAAAETALRDRDVPVARRLLDEAPAEFRNWEWRHLNSRLDRSLRSFDRWRWNVRFVAHSPDGKHLATVAAGQTRVHDEATTEQLAHVEHRAHVRAFDWHPRGEAWVVGTRVGVEVWSWPDAQRIVDEHVGETRGVAFSPDGRYLAHGGHAGVLHVVDTETRKEVFSTRLGSQVHSVAFDASGRWLAAGAWDATVSLFDARTGGRVWQARCGRRGIQSLAFVGDAIAVPSSDGHVDLRRVADGTLVHRLGHDRPIGNEQVAASADGTRLLTSDGPYVHVWDPQSGERLVTYGNDSRSIAASFDPSGTRLVTGSQRGSVLEWHVPRHRDPDVLLAGFHQLAALDYAPSGDAFVAGGTMLRVFDAHTHEEIRNWIGHRGHVHTVRFSPDGRWAASGDYLGDVLIWDVGADQLAHRLDAVTNEGHRAARVAFSADSNHLYTGGTDGALVKWDVKTGKQVARKAIYPGWLSSLAVSYDGRLIAVGEHEGLIRLLDTKDLTELRTCKGHGSIVTELVFQHDNTVLASSSWDRTVRLWDVESGTSIRTLRSLTSDSAGVADALLSATFLPGGERIAACGADCSAKLWDMATGRLVATLRGKHDWMQGVRFSPDGAKLITIEGRGVVRVWETRPYRERLPAQQPDAIFGADVQALLDGYASDPEAALERVRESTALADDVRERALRFVHRHRGRRAALLERAWRTFLPPDGDPTQREVVLGIIAEMKNAGRREGLQDGRRETLYALGAYRAGQYRRARRTSVNARTAPTLHALDLAVLSMTHHRLEEHDDAGRRLAELEDLIAADPSVLEARGVKQLADEARALVR